jgi:hypothetical protein
MKTNQSRIFQLLAALTLLSAQLAKASPTNYVAHEWGTFTSVQGADGALLAWRPLESSRLPGFVYNWEHPGLNQAVTTGLVLKKGALVALQRMETPVIYFYAGEKQTVDVSVNFPQGYVTEWYPQAALQERWVSWPHLEIVPNKPNGNLAASLPLDTSGSHYFTARDTDADYLQVESAAATKRGPEREKFLFYRGVGNFGTPLKVTMTSNDSLTLSNTGSETLAHLFLLGVESRAGQFIEIERLLPSEKRTVTLDWLHNLLPSAKVSKALADQMARSLASEGLYPKEASAMINTWKDSWFEEDGLRVLYVLPREWTDQTLPLTLKPTPRELVRVMVGRAEILTPAKNQELSEALTKASQGDAAARMTVEARFRKLGRFAEPALRLASTNSTPEFNQMAWGLLQAAAKPAPIQSVSK